MAYAEQAYEPSESVKKALYSSLRRYKLLLKRENAKRRAPASEKSEEEIEEVKAE